MSLHPLGWDQAWADALAALQDRALVPARIVAVHRGRVLVRDAAGDRLLPVLGHDAPPLVGDWVGVREGAVRAVLPRRSALEREGAGLVANADRCLIVTSLDRDLNLRRLERFVALARAAGVQPLVVCSKGDLAQDPVALAGQVAARICGSEVLALSARDGWGMPALRGYLVPHRTHVLVGMSGVGKSTLVNLLLGEERQRTLPVRTADDRGRHATTHRELFELPGGALLVDTPGLRLPRLTSTDGLEDAFAEIQTLAAGCRFRDCRHADEPGCAVRDAVDPDRLRSLRKLEREGLSARERRARRRETQKQHTKATRDARRRR